MLDLMYAIYQCSFFDRNKVNIMFFGYFTKEVLYLPPIKIRLSILWKVYILVLAKPLQRISWLFGWLNDAILSFFGSY